MDCTFGRGGHAAAILAQIGREGRVIGIDKDPQAVAAAQKMAKRDPRLTILHGSFASLGQYTRELGVAGKVDGILLDLGVSSPQLDSPERGFSFRHSGPLDMRMDPGKERSAAEWLNSAPQKEIASVLKRYGEERFSGRIAAAIARAREESPIRSTDQLAGIVTAANPSWERDKHPATRTFQAIRIHINRELEELQEALKQVIALLSVGGRFAVISFHSLEDRIVKRFIRDGARGDDHPSDMPIPYRELTPCLRALGRAIRPSADEITENPRARSAVLRGAERLQ